MEERRALLAGGIVLGDSGTIAMVRRKTDGLWFFPKGHSEDGETLEEAARREIEEETGLTNLEFIDDLGAYERPRIDEHDKYDLSEMKEIHMFLFAAPQHAPIRGDMEIEEARWVSFQHVAASLEDSKDRVWFATVFERVRQAIQRD